MASISLSLFVDQNGDYDIDLDDGNGKILGTDLEGSVRKVTLNIEVPEPESQEVDVEIPEDNTQPVKVKVV